MSAFAYRVVCPDNFVAIVIAIDMDHVVAIYPEAIQIRRLTANKVDIVCPEKFGLEISRF
jgi:hypothetical protein